MSCVYKKAEGKAWRGFSLVELLVVIAIIALLLSVLMPSLGRARSMGLRIKCAGNLKQIDVAMNMYLGGNDDRYPCAQDPVVGGYIWLWMGRGWRSFVKPYLDPRIDANNPGVLLCPQDRTEKDKYEATSYAYSMAFYHSPGQIDAMSSTNEQWGAVSVASVPQHSFNVTEPSSKILIGEWLSNHLRIKGKDPGWWGWQGRRNYIFADGQVGFLKAEEIRQANDGLANPNLTKGGITGRDWPRTAEH